MSLMNENLEVAVELNSLMVERGDTIDNATYQYLLTLLMLDDKETEDVFPWDISIIRNLVDYAKELLRERNLFICDPAIICDEEEHLCTLEDCGCKVCPCKLESIK